MSRQFLIVLGIIFLLGVGGFIYTATQSAGGPPLSVSDPDISISAPQIGAPVSSPISVSGTARGTWYFEASAPVLVVDWDGKIIGTGHVQAQGEWMTTDFVPFTGSVEFIRPVCAAGADYCTHGAVIFRNDNPSGDPSRDKAVEIPVKFR